ncbi:MAG TPA: hypothetical protein VL984_05925 [Acidimicrobiales bacterium]|nr:hypothetical protein [Acidimicrobiales bacterium]
MTAGSSGENNPERVEVTVSALAKIAVLLHHFDDQLAWLKSETSPGRLLSISAEDAEVDRALRGLEEALADAVRTLHIQPEHVDVRQRVRGPLNILWADLVEMSPARLRTQWRAQDVPERWPELHRRLLLAIEGAIKELS